MGILEWIVATVAVLLFVVFVCAAAWLFAFALQGF